MTRGRRFLLQHPTRASKRLPRGVMTRRSSTGGHPLEEYGQSKGTDDRLAPEIGDRGSTGIDQAPWDRRAAYASPMTAIPATFRAFVAEKVDGADPPAITRGVREFAASDLPAGDVEIRIGWSSVNYKDGLATRADGRVARISPLIPGIDLAGEVVASDDRSIAVGSQVLAHGYDLGVSRHGGFTEYQRVPAGWVVPLEPGLTPRDAMAIGTAGFTAAMSVVALEERGLSPNHGPVLVTGASGGVGGTAVAILAERGYEVWAATGKADEADRLRSIGAAGILTRDEVTGEGKPLESERWAGAVDAVGGATLPYILRTLRTGAAVAASGNAGGPRLDTTVFPFILRGVALLGMDSVLVPIDRRRLIWDRLATDLRPRDLGKHVDEVTLDTLPVALDGIIAGAARGRWVVRIGG
jgi:acrylyl-CoA reductase (NADPH)